MTTPMAPAPMLAQKWIARAGYLRWIDALVAWLVFSVVAAAALPEATLTSILVVAAIPLAVGAMLQPARVRWRPVSGYVGLAVSRGLRPGDRAWYVRADRADVVVVTARRRWRVSITAPHPGGSESLSVRRTRVFLVPVDGAGGGGQSLRAPDPRSS